MGVNYGGWGCVCYRCMGAGVIGTYIGVEAVHQVGTSSLFIYMMHGHIYIRFNIP